MDIVTRQSAYSLLPPNDDYYKSSLLVGYQRIPVTKEVSRHATGLKTALELVKRDLLLTFNQIEVIEIHQVLEKGEVGIRKLPDTALKNGNISSWIYPSSRQLLMHQKW